MRPPPSVRCATAIRRAKRTNTTFSARERIDGCSAMPIPALPTHKLGQQCRVAHMAQLAGYTVPYERQDEAHQHGDQCAH